MCKDGGKWSQLKQSISDDNKELTDLWMVGAKNRNAALEKGIYTWGQKECTPEILGISSRKTKPILESILRVNRSKDILLSPPVITNNEMGWNTPGDVEFFIDFESHNGALSSIKNVHAVRTQNIIYMLGVGFIHPETKEWTYRDFTSNLITYAEEKRICTEFVEYIQKVSKKYRTSRPKCYHWSNAEPSMWGDVIERHPTLFYDAWIWIDMLRIFKQTPITIRGCKSFSLKDVAKSMKKLNLIHTIWTTKCASGKTAMIGAYNSHRLALQKGGSMKAVPLFKEIITYNEVDVKVLYEILTHLREHHLPKNKRAKHK